MVEIKDARDLFHCMCKLALFLDKSIILIVIFDSTGKIILSRGNNIELPHRNFTMKHASFEGYEKIILNLDSVIKKILIVLDNEFGEGYRAKIGQTDHGYHSESCSDLSNVSGGSL